jgi:hypothetical protein
VKNAEDLGVHSLFDISFPMQREPLGSRDEPRPRLGEAAGDDGIAGEDGSPSADLLEGCRGVALGDQAALRRWRRSR